MLDVCWLLRVDRWLLAAAFFVILRTDGSLSAEEPTPKPPPAAPSSSTVGGEPILTDEITPELRKAVDEGIEWLAGHQNPDGSWGGRYPVATTGLAGLSLLAGGHLPGRGKYGDRVLQAVRYFVRRAAEKQGSDYVYFREFPQPESRMHGHGFATLFLAEAYGMIDDFGAGVSPEELRRTIQKAVHVIEHSQSKQGGWYYEPAPPSGGRNDADEGSVTVTQIQALRAARNSGFRVDPKVIQKAIDYMRRSANADGGIRYSLSNGGNNSTFALTAAGVSVMQFLGRYDMPELKRGLEYMMRELGQRRGNDAVAARGGHFAYENFYATIALWQAGGEYWSKGFPVIRKGMLKSPRRPDASWDDGYGEHLGTAFTVLSLQVPMQYLPIFQR